MNGSCQTLSKIPLFTLNPMHLISIVVIDRPPPGLSTYPPALFPTTNLLFTWNLSLIYECSVSLLIPLEILKGLLRNHYW